MQCQSVSPSSQWCQPLRRTAPALAVNIGQTRQAPGVSEEEGEGGDSWLWREGSNGLVAAEREERMEAGGKGGGKART
jgi:hypothetical protein